MALRGYIETEEQLHNALHYWKNYSFNPSYIKLEDAVRSLDDESKPLVSAYHQFAPRWVVCYYHHHIPCPCLTLFVPFVDYSSRHKARGYLSFGRNLALEL